MSECGWASGDAESGATAKDASGEKIEVEMKEIHKQHTLRPFQILTIHSAQTHKDAHSNRQAFK